MSDLVAFLDASPESDDAMRWCDLAAQRLTDRSDTHPSLADRAKALGLSAQELSRQGFPSMPTPSAAELLLGDAVMQVRHDVSDLWRTESERNWQGRFGHAALVQRQLKAIEPSNPSGDLAPEVLWEKAQKVLSLEGAQGAEPILRQLVAVRPTHSSANLILGKHLLDSLNVEGASHLQRILDLEDDALVPQACGVLTEYFQSVGHAEAAQRVRERLRRFMLEADEARKERAQVGPRDLFRAHELEKSELGEIVAMLRAEPGLDAAWLVQKELVYFRKQRLFVLSVRTAINVWGHSNATRDAELVGRLIPKLKLPGRSLVISPSGGFRKLAKRVVSTPDSQIV
jgi:hypothetical protein